MSTTNKLISILKKEDRSVDDIQFLKVYLSKNKFFQQVFESFKASPEINNELCRAVKYETFPKFSLIFKQGDKNCDKVYIILKGRILIYMKNTIDVFQKETEGQHLNPLELQKKKCEVELLLEKVLEENDEVTRNEVPEQDFYTVLGMEYGKLIIEVEEGALFGEKALIENKPRAATICTKTPCEFLILNKEDFEIVQIKYNKAQQDKKDFIMAKFPFLGNLITSGRVFERLVRFFDEETYHKNQVLVSEGVKVTPENQKLYIIVSGEVQLYKNVTKRILNPHSLKQKQIEQIHIATLGQSEIFGEELFECEGQNISYVNTAVCASPNSQFLTITIQVVEKKMPDQMKEFILANYQYKKNLRATIVLEYEKQQKEVEVMRKKKTKDEYIVEKNLFTKIKLLSKEKDQIDQTSSNKNGLLYPNESYHLKEYLNLDTPQLKISGDNSKDETEILEFNNYANYTPDEYLSFDQIQTQKVDQHAYIYSNLNEKSQQTKSQDQVISKEFPALKSHKSVDSEEFQAANDERLQIIKGNSNQQNMFLFHQLRNDLNDKIKNEGGYKKDINLSFYYEHGLQEDEDTLQFQNKKCNPYPFKLTANHKHLKQLETRLQQKKFQFADAQEILSNTKYYQAKEKTELSLKEMIEQGLTRSKFYQNTDLSKSKKVIELDQSKSNSKQLLSSSVWKKSSPRIGSQKKGENLDYSLIKKNENQYVQKKIGITNMFKDSIKVSDFGNNVQNTGKNLFACSDKIKLHSILKRISDNYKPHNDYFEDSPEVVQMIEMSKYNSEQQFKYYQQSNMNKNYVETRKVLSRSPIVRRLNIAQQSAQQGGGVSIPSNKRYIIDNDHNVNDNFYYYKNSIRPSSDEARYHTTTNDKMKQKNNKINEIESMVMQSSQSLGNKNNLNKSNNRGVNSTKSKISVKYMQLQQPDQNTSESLKNNTFQIDSYNNSVQSSSRLHSNSKIANQRNNSIKHKKLNDSSHLSSPKHVDFSFFNNPNEQNQLNSYGNSISKIKNKSSSQHSSQNQQKESSFSQYNQSKSSQGTNANPSSSSNNNQSEDNQIDQSTNKAQSDENQQNLLENSIKDILKSNQLDLQNSIEQESSSRKVVNSATKIYENNNLDSESCQNNESFSKQKSDEIDDKNHVKKILVNQEFKQVHSNFEIANQIDSTEIQVNNEKQSEFYHQHKKLQGFQIGQAVESTMYIEEKKEILNISLAEELKNPLLDSNSKQNIESQQKQNLQPTIQDISVRLLQESDQSEIPSQQQVSLSTSLLEIPKHPKKKESMKSSSSSSKKSVKKKKSSTISKKKSQNTSNEKIESKNNISQDIQSSSSQIQI